MMEAAFSLLSVLGQVLYQYFSFSLFHTYAHHEILFLKTWMLEIPIKVTDFILVWYSCAMMTSYWD